MGSMQAQEYAGAAEDFGLETVLTAHFRSNHYPPLPYELVPVAADLIAAVNQAIWEDSAGFGFDWDQVDAVTLPAGIEYRGQTEAPASACVEAWHLDSFIDWPEL